MKSEAAQREKRTFFLEHFRSGFHGVSEPFVRTFFLLIAIKVFSADEVGQALVAASPGLGLLLSPIMVFVARSLQIPVSRFAGVVIFCGGALLAFGAAQGGFLSYLAFSLPAVVVTGSCLPLFTEMYQQNYPEEKRGALFGRTQRIFVAVAVVTAWLCGVGLEEGIENWSAWIHCFGLCLAAGGLVLSFSPSKPLEAENFKKSGIPLFRSLRWVVSDGDFRWILGVYMVMGFGNIMMMPLRVIYLADPQYGFNKSPEFIAIITAVIPPIMLFLFTPIWGKLFDRMNFFLLRTILNIFLLLSILVYFLPGTTWGFVGGSLLLGLAFSGGNIAWSLWVTKIAPPDRVADYMAGHTFSTGVRAAIAPLLSVPLAAVVPIEWLVAFSCGLIILSILMLGPEVKTWRARRKSQRLTENMTE